MTAIGGSWRAGARRNERLAWLLCVAAATLSVPALAQSVSVAVPAGTLDTALTSLARAGNTEIISTERGLSAVRTRPVKGVMSVRQALDALLADTGYHAVAIRGGGYRVVRGAMVAATPPRKAPRRAPAPQVAERDPADIIVTGSKQRISLLRYPGSVTSIPVARDGPAAARGDLSDLAEGVPVIESTQLGGGRNKVFIRGIADSSFNGASQSTASVYLDDVQVNYSGSDPGLRLYDTSAVDVMEGPQGTLYGAGAIGGVIRVTSTAPDLTAMHAALSSGVTATRAGAPGFDVSGMANIPVLADTVGFRVVGYRIRDGGYIDDLQRGLKDVNRTDTVGGRAALRVDPGDHWRIELSGAAQSIDARDGQYAEVVSGPLERRSALAQPFDSRLRLGRILLSKDWDSGLKLVSATGISMIDSNEIFDASMTAVPPAPGAPPGPFVPIRYDINNSKRLLTQETRLSRSLDSGSSWVLGFTLLSNRDILARTLGNPGAEASIIGVTNVTQAASVFGEGTLALTHRLSVTAGARATAARIDGEPDSTPRGASVVKGRTTKRIDPTVAASWNFAPRLAAFARYQTGYRTGGVAVARGVGRVADFEADSIKVGEFGLRRVRRGRTGITVSASASYAHWVGIQADLVNRRGQSYTLNLGDARIVTAEAMIDWVPMPGLSAAGSFLVTQNSVTGPVADLSTRNNRRLPETPPLAAQGVVTYKWRAGRSVELRAGGSANYIGRSVLGVGDLLDISQGRYVLLGLSGGAKWRNMDFSLVLDNITDRTTNRFAFGNPFALGSRDETTPPRPFNARVGVSIAW